MVASNKKSNTMSNNSASKVFCHQRLKPANTREGDFKGKGKTTSFMKPRSMDKKKEKENILQL